MAARIYARGDGTILRFLHNDEYLARYPDDPPGAADDLEFDEVSNATLDFDPATNPEIVAEMGRNPGAYSLSAGKLLKNGQAVAVNAPGRAYQDRLAMPAIQAKLDADQPLNAAEQRVVLRSLLRRRGRPQVDTAAAASHKPA